MASQGVNSENSHKLLLREQLCLLHNLMNLFLRTDYGVDAFHVLLLFEIYVHMAFRGTD